MIVRTENLKVIQFVGGRTTVPALVGVPRSTEVLRELSRPEVSVIVVEIVVSDRDAVGQQSVWISNGIAVQGAHRGVGTLKPRKCYVIAQEQSAPYDVAVMEVSNLHCRGWFNDAMAIYNKWLSGDRSGAYGKLFSFELPTWAMDRAAPVENVETQMDSMFNVKEA